MDDLIRVAHGLWRPPEQAADALGRAAALLRICPAGTVVAGMTAAWLHGLWLPREPSPGDPIEVIVRPEALPQRDRAHNRRRELRARRQLLLPDEVTEVCGVPVCSEARCWLDLADRLSMPDLVALGDSALRGAATEEELHLLVGRARHRRGVIKARRALPLLDARSRSRPESHLRFAIVDGGLPVPAVNRPIYDDTGAWLGEPDLSYDDVRLALEYNGALHADVARMRRDITRELDLEVRGGWQTVVYGPAEVFGRPDAIVIHVRRLREKLLSGRLLP